MTDKPVLVDTSAWLLALRKEFIVQIRNRIDYLIKENLILTTGIIRMELLSGTKNEVEYMRLKKRLSAFRSIKTDESTWEKTCEVGFHLRRKGVTVPYTDILIATCALVEECVVLHVDNHFDLMSEHLDLKTESYVSEIREKII